MYWPQVKEGELLLKWEESDERSAINGYGVEFNRYMQIIFAKIGDFV